MIDILAFLPANRHQSPSGWWSFDAPCCHHRGQRPDTRGRGGLLIDSDHWNFNCFNCNFTAGYHRGERLSMRARQLLAWLGVDAQTIDAMQLTAMRDRELMGLADAPMRRPIKIKFDDHCLEPGLEHLSVDNPDHERFISYLTGRGIDPTCYAYLVSPGARGRDANRIVIPFTYQGRIVGHTARFIDGRTPKYIHRIPTGYAFGTDLQHADWRRVIVAEGVFDALAIDGIAVLHNDINDIQASLITRLNREVIVVPDQDRAGLKLAERALELGWAVSVPEWDAKDVAEAVEKYGRLGTMITIIDNATTNPIKFKLKRRRFA